ncbi:hypothetical protein [Brevibacillus formosus]|uniref:hypothetical protein n=1 Tax=Brevibacillus formosus TaxID=54913 RepID=UPI003F1DCDB2
MEEGTRSMGDKGTKDDGDERSLIVWGMPEKVRGRITMTRICKKAETCLLFI